MYMRYFAVGKRRRVGHRKSKVSLRVVIKWALMGGGVTPNCRSSNFRRLLPAASAGKSNSIVAVSNLQLLQVPAEY
jgi:hypothetical protein